MKQHVVYTAFESAGPDGAIRLTFPDNGAGPGYGGIVEHLRSLLSLDPTQISDLMRSARRAALVGLAQIVGADTSNLMEPWSDLVEALPRDLTDDEYKRMLQGDITPERALARKDK